MASLAKSLFSSPVNSISCCTSSGFQQEHKVSREEMRGMNVKRRWSSEEQFQRSSQAETRRRNSFYAQQRVERAAMREHFRGKYNLTKNLRDENHVKEAGGNVRMSKDIRAMVNVEEPSSEEFSILGFLGHPSMDLTYLKKGTQSTMNTLPSGTRCILM